jgi:hypothetical protein
MGYFRMLAAIPGFFLSALVLMLIWGAVCVNYNIPKIDYPQAMLITIMVWLTVAPLAAVGHKWHH